MNILTLGIPSRWKKQVAAPLLRRGHTVTAGKTNDVPDGGAETPRFEAVLFYAVSSPARALADCRRLRKRFPAAETLLVACKNKFSAEEAEDLLAAGADETWRLGADADEEEVRAAVLERHAAEPSRLPNQKSYGLDESRRWFPADDVPYGIIRSTADGRLLEVNQSLAEMLGYASREELLRISHARELFYDPEDRDRMFSRFPLHIKGVEVMWKRRDGSPIPVQISGRKIYDARGKWIEAEGVVLDWSPQREALDLLRLQRDLAIELAAAEEMPAVFEALLEAVLQLDGVDGAAIYLRDPAADSLTLRAARGGSEQLLRAVKTYPPESDKTKIIMQGKPLYTKPQELSPPVADAFRKEGVQFVGVVPVLNQGGVIASLNFVSRTRDFVSLPTRHAVETIAHWIGGSVARIRSKEDLKSSQQNLRNLFDSLEDLVFIVDEENRILDVNPAVHHLLGYEKEELLGRCVFDIHPSEQRPDLLSRGEEIRSRKPVLLTNPLVTKTGEKVPVEILVVPGFWGGKQVTFGVGRNLSEMQNMSRALEDSNKRFRVIFENAAAGLALIDVEGKILEINSFIARIAGRPPEEIIGRNYREFIHPDHRKELEMRQQRLLDEQLPWVQVELRYYRADGTIHWGRVTVSRMTLPETVAQGMIAIVEDIDARKQAEDALRISESRLTHIIQSLPDVVVVTDLEGVTRYVNRANPHMTPETAPGINIPLLAAEEFKEEVRLAFARCVSHKEIQDLEARDVKDLWWRVRLIPLLDQDQVRELMVVASDVTDKKHAADRLRESEARYRELVENLPDFVVVTDLEGTICYINRSNPYMTSESCKRQNAISLTAEEFREQVRSTFRNCISQKESQDYEARDVDGRWWKVRLIPLIEKEAVREMMFLCKEITAQKLAADQLRESEARYRGLVENLPDFVLVVDRQAKIRYANHTPPEIRQEDLLGAEGFSFLVESSQSAARAAFIQAFRENRVQTVDVLDRFGHIWSTRVVPFPPGEESNMAIIICTEVTQQRKAQEALLGEKRLLQRLLDLQESDRQITAYELHDGIAQQLAGAVLFLENHLALHDSNPVLAQEQMHDGLNLIRRSLDDVRRLISGLRPLILDEEGIIQAVEYLIAEAGKLSAADIVFQHDVRFQRLAPPLETAVFRIVQESLANACRHSQSDFIRIQLLQAADALHIKVADEGVGFDPDVVSPDHFGLRGIRERARLFEGRATIRSRPGEGAEIHVILPLVLPVPENRE